MYSISPKVLLTLIELRTGLIRNIDATEAQIENPIGAGEPGFSNQVDNITELMFGPFYEHFYGYSTLEIDRTRLAPDHHQRWGAD